MVVEAASSEHTLSVRQVWEVGLSVLALSIADPLYRSLKIKNAIWEGKRDKFWKSKIKWNTKTKNFYPF